MAKWHEALQEGKATTANGQAAASQNMQVRRCWVSPAWLHVQICLPAHKPTEGLS